MMNAVISKKGFGHNLKIEGQTTCLQFTGSLDADSAAAMWREISGMVQTCSTQEFLVDLERITYLDTAGAAFLHHLENTSQKGSVKKFRIINATKEFSSFLALSKSVKLVSLQEKSLPGLSFVEKTGRCLAVVLSEIYEFTTYIGQIIWGMISSAVSPRSIRWVETLGIAERAGVDALPIVALISFIVGLVMAFQAAIPMRMFGAELYVSNLIGIAMVRELGPLMTAIVLAGRSASAFAAEIGTMRINEEIDALTVMGIDPIKFLIIPRIIATTLMTPLLTVFANLVGILGGAVVIISLGYPIISYINQITSFVKLHDLTGGLIKSFVFGILIAAIGCIRGYQTKSGPSAVGESTTRAVVTAIIMIAVFDGIFSIIYYTLEI